jgi:hypothetical protein
MYGEQLTGFVARCDNGAEGTFAPRLLIRDAEIEGIRT